MKYTAVLASCLLALAPSFVNAASLSHSALFSRGAEYANVKISPEGDYLSALTTHDGKKTLIILETETKKMINAINFPGNAEVGNYEWVNEERIVLQKVYLKGWSDVPQYYGELMAVNADGSKGKYLFGFNSGEQQTGSHIKKNTAIRATAYILDPLPENDKFMLVNAIPWGSAATLGRDSLQHVYKVNVKSGVRRKVTTSPIGNANFLTDNEGEVKFVAGLNNKNQLQTFYRKDGDWINTNDLNIGLTDFNPISFADKANTIYAAARENNQTASIYKIDLVTGQKEKVINDENVDPSNFWINKQSKQLYAVEYENGYPTYAFVDQQDEHTKLLKQLIASLPGHQVQIISETTNAKLFVIKAFNDRNPGDYYLFDAEKVTLDYLASEKSWLDPDAMAEVKPISFTSRDGKIISGYLTLPEGKEAKNLPLVVNPHGGPHYIRDWWSFNPQNQLLASQGIAVLQVNFRGSGGYGEQFQQDGYQKWGADIQYDIIDGTKYVIEQGFADKDRVCIVGGSFGGYSALQSAIIEPDLFKCAIGFAGVYDLEMMFNEGDIKQTRSGTSYLKQVLGENPQQLKAMSPAFNTDKLKASLLLVHGGNDERAPIEQLESLEKGLKQHQYPYEKLIMDDEGHGFYNDEHRAKYYDKMLSFLKDNLKL
ncbi:S9 family peptidase [Shewanella electrodiphila]|uniref:S9 family peptidase n=1 Tax=Shewanella electrodiphila TaxID=934143 RepID=A0ABT0KUU0_9GAMM|nr:S9 family peptidase [Shewanella electrodiphila]MCL1047454.1 S9 family peptidase [Shewanella electrodiphila]